MVIRYVMTLTAFGDIHSFIFSVVAAPLTKLGGSFTALLVAMFAAQILWLVGVHGAMVVYSVFMPIWDTASDCTKKLITPVWKSRTSFPEACSGWLYSWACALFFRIGYGDAAGKIEQYRVLGKLSLIPNIGAHQRTDHLRDADHHELHFGYPIHPGAFDHRRYPLSASTGILPYLPGIAVPLGVPVIINGLMAGGWRWAVYQALMIAVSYFVYLPFFKVMDKSAYKQEVEAQQQTEATEFDKRISLIYGKMSNATASSMSIMM